MGSITKYYLDKELESMFISINSLCDIGTYLEYEVDKNPNNKVIKRELNKIVDEIVEKKRIFAKLKTKRDKL